MERTYEGAIEAAKQLQSVGMSLDKYQRSRHNTMDAMHHYVARVGLEAELARLSVVHVAGTKGKGSTCAFTESILRSYGLRTGLYTSPHLMDVCERFRVDGLPISRSAYAAYFWSLWDDLTSSKEQSDGYETMPNYFRFMTLLAFRIFLREQVDVCVLEVGIGGRLDATNVISMPVVCGVASLGYDHMELLGGTLDLIAAEKAGIFKTGVPAYTVPQDPLAMGSLVAKARAVKAPLRVVPSLSAMHPAKSIPLGLAGKHQEYNAALAVCLSRAWRTRTESGTVPPHVVFDRSQPHATNGTDRAAATPSEEPPVATVETDLEEQELRGLAQCCWPGRGQVLPHPRVPSLTVYLDGAHTGESMQACVDWFRGAVDLSTPEHANGETKAAGPVRRVLVFNSAPGRDPALLLRPLATADARKLWDQVVFTPMVSSKPAILPPSDAVVRTATAAKSWQETLAERWAALTRSSMNGNGQAFVKAQQGDVIVSKSLSETLTMIEAEAGDIAHPTAVLVTGSLYLVGDLLTMLGWQQPPAGRS